MMEVGRLIFHRMAIPTKCQGKVQPAGMNYFIYITCIVNAVSNIYGYINIICKYAELWVAFVQEVGQNNKKVPVTDQINGCVPTYPLCA